jgi:MOSC N-terminal beta barrel domain
MQTDATSSAAGQTEAGSVVALWRHPVKSMMGEELNSSEVTDRGLLGDRQFAVMDRATGKVGGPRIRGSGATSLTFGRAMPRLRNLEDGFPRFGSHFLTGRWLATIELIWNRFFLAHLGGKSPSWRREPSRWLQASRRSIGPTWRVWSTETP